MEYDSYVWLADLLIEMDAKLPKPEQEFADSLLRIVSKYGKLSNGDGKGIWVGYKPGSENEDSEMGIKCENCYLHETDKVCKIYAGEIEPEGICRLAAIPDTIVKYK